jgi:NADH-quinone oxidoreductase subunit J
MTAFFFYLFSGLAVLCAVMTVTRRDAVTSAFWLISCFLNVAALFAMLSAHFMAVLQVLIYAGAIMVFFLFVTMFLGHAQRTPRGKGLLVPMVIIATILALAWVMTELLSAHREGFEPAPDGYGGVITVSRLLLTDYVFLFEMSGLLLLVAVIGAVFIARRIRRQRDTFLEGGSRV